MALTGKQKRTLRALGHHLAVVVQVGKTGVTAGVVKATAQALKDHELVKVKIEAEKEDRAEALARLATETGSEVAQSLGKTALLFKQRKNKPKIKLDRAKAPPKDVGPNADEAGEEAEASDGVDEAENDDDDDDADDPSED